MLVSHKMIESKVLIIDIPCRKAQNGNCYLKFEIKETILSMANEKFLFATKNRPNLFLLYSYFFVAVMWNKSRSLLS